VRFAMIERICSSVANSPRDLRIGFGEVGDRSGQHN
jgi:hypothetical protein